MIELILGALVVAGAIMKAPDIIAELTDARETTAANRAANRASRAGKWDTVEAERQRQHERWQRRADRADRRRDRRQAMWDALRERRQARRDRAAGGPATPPPPGFRAYAREWSADWWGDRLDNHRKRRANRGQPRNRRSLIERITERARQPIVLATPAELADRFGRRPDADVTPPIVASDRPDPWDYAEPVESPVVHADDTYRLDRAPASPSEPCGQCGTPITGLRVNPREKLIVRECPKCGPVDPAHLTPAQPNADRGDNEQLRAEIADAAPNPLHKPADYINQNDGGNVNSEAAGPEEIRSAFGAGIAWTEDASTTAGASAAQLEENAEAVEATAATFEQAAERYESLQMAASTVGHLREAAEAARAAAADYHAAAEAARAAEAKLQAAQESMNAALTDFNAKDGAVADTAQEVGNLADREVLQS